MKKIIITLSLALMAVVYVNAQAPAKTKSTKKVLAKVQTAAAPTANTVDAKAAVAVEDVTESKSEATEKKDCSAEEKKSCESKSKKAGCCSSKKADK
jgi:hypothetical protein